VDHDTFRVCEGQGPEGGGTVEYADRKFTWDYSHAGPLEQLVVATKGFRHARHRAMTAASTVWEGYTRLLKRYLRFVNEIATENYITKTHVSLTMPSLSITSLATTRVPRHLACALAVGPRPHCHAGFDLHARAH